MKARASRQGYPAGIRRGKGREVFRVRRAQALTWALVEDERGRIKREGKISHARGALWEFLKGCESGSPVAVETVGNWYWIVDEIEAAGLLPRLVHPGKAKVMSGCINKPDKLDVRGLNRLQRSGTLPLGQTGSGSRGVSAGEAWASKARELPY